MAKQDKVHQKILTYLKKQGYKITQDSCSGEIFVDYKNDGSSYPELIFDDMVSIKNFLNKKVGLSLEEISGLKIDSGSIASQLYEELRCNAVRLEKC